MSSDSQPVFDVHSDDAKNRSIPELVSYLKWAFRPPDFEAVKHILASREEKIKEELLIEIEKKKKEYETLEAKHGELLLTNILVEDKLKAYNRGCDELKEQVTRLGEERRLIQDRERRAEERHEKLLEEVKKQEESEKDRLIELQSRNKELECYKRKAEAEIEVWRRRFGELESRVSRLEEDAGVLMSGESLFSRRVEEEVEAANAGSNEVMGEKGRSKASKCQNEKDVGSGSASLDPWRIEENGSNYNEKIFRLAGGGSTGHPQTEGSRELQDEGLHSIDMVHVMEVKESDPSDCEMMYERPVRKKLVFEAVSPNNSGRHESVDVVNIIDSDDEMPSGKNFPLASFKRKREPCILVKSENDDDDAYNPSNGKRKTKKLQELIDEPRGYCSAAPASSGGNNVDKSVTPLRQNLMVLRRCNEEIGAEQNSQCHLSGSSADGQNGCYGEDGSTDSTTNSEDDVDDTYIKKLSSKLGKTSKNQD